MKFRKKPVVIEAIRASDAIWRARHAWNDLPAWMKAPYERGEILFMSKQINIHTLEGTMSAFPDDWIICGVKGELYPCKPDIFEATYEPA
jgi:hypothetical protein